MVVWLTGLSGAGKTTVGERLWSLWKARVPNVVMVDGDVMRRIAGADTGHDPYSPAGRRANLERIVETCRWLDGQGIHVVCCVLAIFDDVLVRNRETFREYLEVRLSAPREVLFARDPKGLYAKARAGQMPNVVGVDLPYALTSKPDLTFDTSEGSAEDIARAVLARVERGARA